MAVEPWRTMTAANVLCLERFMFVCLGLVGGGRASLGRFFWVSPMAAPPCCGEGETGLSSCGYVPCDAHFVGDSANLESWLFRWPDCPAGR